MSSYEEVTGGEDVEELIRQFVESSPEMSPGQNSNSTDPPNPPHHGSGNGGCNVESYLQLEVKLQASQLENLFLTTDNENLKADVASKGKEISGLQAIKGLLSSSVVDLEELAQSRQDQIDRLKIELETEKRGKLEAERKVHDIREALKLLRSSVGNALGTPSPSVPQDRRAMQAVQALSVKYQAKFDESKKDRQQLKEGLGFMTATLNKFKTDLIARRNVKKSVKSGDPEPPILEKELPVPVPSAPSRSHVASTSSAAFSQPMDEDNDDEVEEAPPILTKQVPYRPDRHSKSQNASQDIKPIIHDNEYKKFVCSKCHSRFRTLAGLRYHMAGRHKEVLHADKKAGCRSCGKTFPSVAECLKHAKQCRLRAGRTLRQQKTD